MRRLIKFVRIFFKKVAALTVKYGPELLKVKAVGWSLYFISGAILIWVMRPDTPERFALVAVIAGIIAKSPFYTWLAWKIWKRRKKK